MQLAINCLTRSMSHYGAFDRHSYSMCAFVCTLFILVFTCIKSFIEQFKTTDRSFISNEYKCFSIVIKLFKNNFLKSYILIVHTSVW